MDYFAYGSNMVLEHMLRICGRHCFLLGQGTLNNYEMGPDKRGYINLRPQPGKIAYGVLYELNQEALDALDNFEGYPQVFGREKVEVTDEEGKKHSAWVYLESLDQFGGDYVKEEYLKRVLLGARQNGLPEEYIAFIEKFKSK